jgi:nitrite transporter NirC
MYQETIGRISDLAASRAAGLRERPFSFLTSSMMAGAYIGVGVVLMLTVGTLVEPAWRKLAMSASFGIALTLVVFAGADLFTGLTMFMTQGALARRVNWSDAGSVWVASWVGNFLGVACLIALFVLAGGGPVQTTGHSVLVDIVTAKTAASAPMLFGRGLLCNWLVCLALWMSARMTSDGTKCVVIYLCVFTFVACGFEHSIANMAIFSLALLSEHPSSISIAAVSQNLLWVTLGNLVSGAAFMGAGYFYVSGPETGARAPVGCGDAQDVRLSLGHGTGGFLDGRDLRHAFVDRRVRKETAFGAGIDRRLAFLQQGAAAQGAGIPAG